jgi:hypothetical protein
MLVLHKNVRLVIFANTGERVQVELIKGQLYGQ